MGTGTGILSIACLKMEAKTAYRIDSNSRSTDTAKKNRSLNGLEKNMPLWRGEVLDFLDIDAELVIANLHFQVIDQITDQEPFYSKTYYILSGLLGHEGHLTEEKLKKRLHLLHRLQENFWFSYLFKSIEAS